MHKKLLIIQKSKPGTGSTLAANIVWGLLTPERPVRYVACPVEEAALDAMTMFPRAINLMKTHTWDIKTTNDLFSESFDVVFVCTERGRKKLSEADRSLSNVISFRYKDILADESKSIEEVVQRFYQKLSEVSPRPLQMSIRAALKRVADMEIRYHQIANRPFSYVEKFYHIHGSHRGRWEN